LNCHTLSMGILNLKSITKIIVFCVVVNMLISFSE
jgi:hypothetical protein